MGPPSEITELEGLADALGGWRSARGARGAPGGARALEVIAYSSSIYGLGAKNGEDRCLICAKWTQSSLVSLSAPLPVASITGVITFLFECPELASL